MSGSINGLGGSVLPPLPDSTPINSAGATTAAGSSGTQATGMSGMTGLPGTSGMSGMSGMTGMSGMSGTSGMTGMNGLSGMQMPGAASPLAGTGASGSGLTGGSTGTPTTGASGSAQASGSASGAAGTSSGNSALSASGEDTFLKLLVAQMKNQDPSSPMDTTSFVTELAQFNTVEQMLNLSQTMQSELSAQQATEGTVLLGRTVTYAVPSIDGSGSTPGQGLVQGVSLGSGGVQLQVNGQTIPLGQVTGVSP